VDKNTQSTKYYFRKDIKELMAQAKRATTTEGRIEEDGGGWRRMAAVRLHLNDMGMEGTI
jgi:hypothetical protein